MACSPLSHPLLCWAALAASVALGCATTTQAPAAAVLPDRAERDELGTSGLGLWHAFTPAEVAALEGAEAANAGDPDALLALSVLASGGPRDEASYARYRGLVHAFVEEVRPALEAEPDPWQQAFLLHKAMHTRFLSGDEPELAGYEWGQSTVTGIFETGRFNCISSALLYLILARHFDLAAQGVLMPEHAFVQIVLPGDKVIEVETTSVTGFDWVHDAEFYAEAARSWSAERGLRPSTLADYEARSLVTPLALVAHNMRNQHTSPERMPERDRMRLYEASSMLDPTSSERQVARANHYLRESYALHQAGEHALRARLFDVILPFARDLATRFPDEVEPRQSAAWLLASGAEALANVERDEEALALIDERLPVVPPDLPDARKILSTYHFALQLIARRLVEAGAAEQAVAIKERHVSTCRLVDKCMDGLAWLYSRWGTELWTSPHWERAADLFLRGAAVATSEETRASMTKDAGIAYENWSKDHQREGNWPRAAEVLERCIERVPSHVGCREGLDELRRRHRL